MMRLTFQKQRGVVIFVFDDSNTREELHESIDTYFNTMNQYAKSAERVIFEIDKVDMDGWWYNFAMKWIDQKGSIHLVCSDENILDTVFPLFGPEATFHKTVEEAITAIK